MSEFVRFTVFGRAQPQGSSRAFVIKGRSQPIITSDNPKLKSWRQECSITAMAAMNAARRSVLPRGVAVDLTCTFYFAKPKSAKKRVVDHLTKPDWDKLARAIGDSMSGTVYTDDSQVRRGVVEKQFGLPERVEILIEIQDDLFTEMNR